MLSPYFMRSPIVLPSAVSLASMDISEKVAFGGEKDAAIVVDADASPWTGWQCTRLATKTMNRWQPLSMVMVL